MNITIDHYESPLGKITLAAYEKALIGLWFDGQKYFGQTPNIASISALSELPQKETDEKPRNLPILQQTKQWLDLYFSGKVPDFTPPLSLDATPFRRSVWEIMLAIPYGQTMTYQEIARQMAEKLGRTSMSAQAAGNAVAHNPCSLIIPCHRVVGSNGSLTGYAGGMDKKIKLLTLEHVDLSALFIPNTHSAK